MPTPIQLEVLKAAQKHALEIFQDFGYSPVIKFEEYDKQSEKNYRWEFYVEYAHNDGTGDVGCSFDQESL